jgi:hypothetical protein
MLQGQDTPVVMVPAPCRSHVDLDTSPFYVLSYRSCRYLLALGLFDGVTILVRKSLLLHDPDSLVDGIQLGHGSSVGVPVVVGPGEVLAVVAGKVHVV